jgi:hypothetical protein
MGERFDVEAELVFLIVRTVVGGIESDTDLLIEYTFVMINLIRFRMFIGQLHGKLLIAEPRGVDSVFFVLILIAFNASLHAVVCKLLDLVVPLHIIRYNSYILYVYT